MAVRARAATSGSRAASSPNGRRSVVPPAGQPLRSYHRRRGLIAGGVLLVVVCALLAGVLYSHAGGKVSVIVTARAVPVGSRITADDLSTAQIATDTVPAYAGRHMSEVIGKTAAVGLVTGEIISPAMLTDQPALPSGSAVVGVALKPGQLPAAGLSPGDTVMVVILPASQSGGTPPTNATGGSGGSSGSDAPSVLVESAPVVDAATLASGQGSVVSVGVPRADAAQLAAASSAGLVALVKVGPS